MADNGPTTIPVPKLSPEQLKALDKVGDEHSLDVLREQARQTLALLERVREVVKDVDGFWAYTLLQHSVFAEACSAKLDAQALGYLTNIELKQSVQDPRPFELVFHFKENPFFSNATLAKRYDLPAGQKLVEDGSVTQEMLDYDQNLLVPSTTTIDWKQDLIKKYPRSQTIGDEDEFDGDAGSFFHFFTEKTDPYDLAFLLVDPILADLVDCFKGVADGCVMDDDDVLDEEDELDEESGDDEAEIDLEAEEPSKKKRKA